MAKSKGKKNKFTKSYEKVINSPLTKPLSIIFVILVAVFGMFYTAGMIDESNTQQTPPDKNPQEKVYFFPVVRNSLNESAEYINYHINVYKINKGSDGMGYREEHFNDINRLSLTGHDFIPTTLDFKRGIYGLEVDMFDEYGRVQEYAIYVNTYVNDPEPRFTFFANAPTLSPDNILELRYYMPYVKQTYPYPPN